MGAILRKQLGMTNENFLILTLTCFLALVAYMLAGRPLDENENFEFHRRLMTNYFSDNGVLGGLEYKGATHGINVNVEISRLYPMCRYDLKRKDVREHLNSSESYIRGEMAARRIKDCLDLKVGKTSIDESNLDRLMANEVLRKYREQPVISDLIDRIKQDDMLTLQEYSYLRAALVAVSRQDFLDKNMAKVSQL